jgi:hypothetical protein
VRVAARAPGPPALARAPGRVRRLPRRRRRRRFHDRGGVGVVVAGGRPKHLAAAGPDGAVLPSLPLHRPASAGIAGFVAWGWLVWLEERGEEVVGDGNWQLTIQARGKGRGGRPCACGWLGKCVGVAKAKANHGRTAPHRWFGWLGGTWGTSIGGRSGGQASKSVDRIRKPKSNGRSVKEANSILHCTNTKRYSFFTRLLSGL